MDFHWIFFLAQDHLGLEHYTSYSFHSIAAKLDDKYADNVGARAITLLGDLQNASMADKGGGNPKFPNFWKTADCTGRQVKN